jgi:hypothetical protein
MKKKAVDIDILRKTPIGENEEIKTIAIPFPRIKKYKTPEGDVLKACLDYLRVRGYKAFFRVNNGAFKTERGGFLRSTNRIGVADIIGVHNGRAYAIEVKSDTGRQSRGQIDFMDDWQSEGGAYVLARSVEDLRKNGL